MAKYRDLLMSKYMKPRTSFIKIFQKFWKILISCQYSPARDGEGVLRGVRTKYTSDGQAGQGFIFGRGQCGGGAYIQYKREYIIGVN